MNERICRILEYDKIIERLKSYLVSDIGRQLAESLIPSSDYRFCTELLEQTDEAVSVYSRIGHSPVTAFPDLRDLLLKVHAIHALECGELLSVARCLFACRTAKESIERDETIPIAHLRKMSESLPSHRSIEEEIRRCILSEDEIADNASPSLAKIRRQIRIQNENLREKLNAFIKSPMYGKYLQDPIITVRNGHYAIPLKAEYRGQVPGIVHDASGSGQTLFVEPAVAVDIGNEIRRLEGEERAEIGRILAGLTSLVEPVAPALAEGLRTLGTLDVIFAKAALAKSMFAVRPSINQNGIVRIVKGKHPLLDPDTVVPIDIRLGDEFSSLIITGPNTGGKTVTLKTVGLFTLMAMSGLFVPADSRTILNIYNNVFADIGDEQSIEQSLSTFSSHMKTIVGILNSADAGSLVLLDELGSGTDPTEGAALAQAILENLYDKKVSTLATTHYSEIKAFALNHEGMQNASMEFDIERLCPTYRLFIGIPGKSNAFEISEKLGLDHSIIESAKGFLKVKDVAFEDILTHADLARREAEQELETAAAEKRRADIVLAEAEKLRSKLEEDKNRVHRQARDDARKLINDTKQEMELLIKDLRALPNMDASLLEKAIREARERLNKAYEKAEPAKEAAPENPEAPLSVLPGENVFVVSLGKEAVVLKKEDAKNDVLIQAGIIKMKVPLNDLKRIPAKKEKKKHSVKLDLHDAKRSFLELDLRGKIVDESTIEIDRFIDDAILSGIKEFSVIHGKGTGALRAGVQAYLKHHPAVKSFRIGAYGEGDAGVTVVTLK